MSAADTPRAFLTATGVGPGTDGSISVPENGQVTTVAPLRSTSTGTLFGPLELRARQSDRPTDDTSAPVQLSDFQYYEEEPGLLDRLFEDSFFGGLLGLGIVATHDHDDAPLSRRQVLLGAATLVGVAAAGTQPARADTPEPITIAEWDLRENRHGLQLRIVDVVADVLPSDATYYVSVGGRKTRRFTADEQSVVVPPGWTGRVELSTDEERSAFQRVRAMVRDDEFRYDSLSLPQPASAYEHGETVVVSDDPVVVAPLRETDRDGDDVIVRIGGQSVPHRLEDASHPVGYYVVTDVGLVYRVGEVPPSSADVEVVVNPSRFAEFRDDLSR